MKLGNLEIRSQLALAPMAGVTDLAFRQICSELGAGLTVTIVISAAAQAGSISANKSAVKSRFIRSSPHALTHPHDRENRFFCQDDE